MCIHDYKSLTQQAEPDVLVCICVSNMIEHHLSLRGSKSSTTENIVAIVRLISNEWWQNDPVT